MKLWKSTYIDLQTGALWYSHKCYSKMLPKLLVWLFPSSTYLVIKFAMLQRQPLRSVFWSLWNCLEVVVVTMLIRADVNEGIVFEKKEIHNIFVSRVRAFKFFPSSNVCNIIYAVGRLWHHGRVINLGLIVQIYLRFSVCNLV